jgi:histone-lysine N-methyltransferase SETMAR
VLYHQIPSERECETGRNFRWLIAQHGEGTLSRGDIYDWYSKISEGPEHFKTQLPAGKVTVNVVRGSEGAIHIDFLSGATINAQYYSNLLCGDAHQLSRKKIPGKLSEVIPLLEHARPDEADLTKTTLAAMGPNIMNHPTYSPDLAPSDFHLFVRMKVYLGQKFQTGDELKRGVLSWLHS